MNGCMMPRMTAVQAQVLLRQRLCGQVRDLRVRISERGIVLHGRALTPYARQAAEQAFAAALRLPIAADVIEC